MTCNLVEVIDVWKKHVAAILKVKVACGKVLIWAGWTGWAE
jgi:hypothetical protein